MPKTLGILFYKKKVKIFYLRYFLITFSMSISNNISKDLQDVLNKSMKCKTKDLLSETSNSKAVKPKETINEICSCAMKYQTKGKARDAIQKGREVILVTIEETVTNKKTGTTTKEVTRAFSRCKKTVKEDGMCWKHSNSKNIFNYLELSDKNDCMIATGNEEFFKKKGKLIQPSDKKRLNIDPVLKECIENKEHYAKLIDFAKSLISAGKQKPKMSMTFDIDDEEEVEEVEEVEEIPVKEEVVEKVKDPFSDEDASEVDASGDEASGEDEASVEDEELEEDEQSVEETDGEYESTAEIETTDGKKFYVDSQMIVYEPEEDDEATPFGKLIEVKYKSAPFHLQKKDSEETKYYICGTRIDVNDDTYWRCKLSNKTYSFEQNEDGLHDYTGQYKEVTKKDGVKRKFLPRGSKSWKQAIVF